MFRAGGTTRMRIGHTSLPRSPSSGTSRIASVQGTAGVPSAAGTPWPSPQRARRYVHTDRYREMTHMHAGALAATPRLAPHPAYTGQTALACG